MNTAVCNRTFIVVGLLGVLLLIGCKTLNKNVTYSEMVGQASSHAKRLYQEPEYETCKIDHREYFNEVTLKNNLWGRSKLDKPEAARLCSFKSGDQYGWKWELPTNARGVIGYPAIQIGRNPFEKGNPPVAEFPVQVSEIETLRFSYDVETQVKHRKYNLAFDLWLTNAKDYGLKNITTEIMIWEDYFDFSPNGKKVATIISPSGSYDVYKGHLDNPAFSQDWDYIAFMRTSPRSKGEVDLSFFLTYLVKQGYISATDYFTSIEFGNEIGNSSGYTFIREFDWELQTNK